MYESQLATDKINRFIMKQFRKEKISTDYFLAVYLFHKYHTLIWIQSCIFLILAIVEASVGFQKSRLAFGIRYFTQKKPGGKRRRAKSGISQHTAIIVILS